MTEDEFLAARFEEHRARLRNVAYRVLGSPSEADDAVQEAWLRVNAAGAGGVENLSGWLTTIVTRVALNMLKSRASRREDFVDDQGAQGADEDGPEESAVLADSVGFAMLMVLDTLTPSERVAFVLHDIFTVPFDEIARIMDRTPASARQLASRARRRIQGAPGPPEAAKARQRAVVDAFLRASQLGDLSTLITLLDPDVALHADQTAARAGAPGLVLGAVDVAGTFSGRAQAARPALINGTPGLVWPSAEHPKVVFAFTITNEMITMIDMVSAPDHLALLDIRPHTP
ncbi:sigma-70 family RNA polymerase sigma factor [Actinomadura darangshiensis]|uniref:Sigma-70 family RNA polymerase sigma factor n=1 Tax=Actinomadura darangshiensis TaxID=705336 RepID=A0A4R5BXP4_9ACTN|nr:sigma-70 family RNA polymerase sigma factor [Actinomadura darangshiensis]TDD89112.1 sigma-70 family RNA polymerase sigma factor [Actinomadura darangshiensis]